MKSAVLFWKPCPVTNVALPWSREYSFDEAYGGATLTELAAGSANDTATREKSIDSTCAIRSS